METTGERRADRVAGLSSCPGGQSLCGPDPAPGCPPPGDAQLCLRRRGHGSDRPGGVASMEKAPGCLPGRAGEPHLYMAYIGVGEALAVLHRNPEPYMARLEDTVNCWLVVEGYGFHKGLFHRGRSLAHARIPGRL